MLNLRYLSYLEDNWQEATARVLRKVRRDIELRRLGPAFEQEMELLAGELLRGITKHTSDPETAAKRFEAFGRNAFERGYELHALVRGLQLARTSAVELIQEEYPLLDALRAFNEAQFQQQVNSAADFAILNVVSGFEHARAAETALFALTGSLPRRRPSAA